MKPHRIALTLCLAALAPSAMASIIATDNFNYAAGELNGQNGGSGWAGAWSAATAVTQIVAPGALQFTGNNDNAATRQ